MVTPFSIFLVGILTWRTFLIFYTPSSLRIKNANKQFKPAKVIQDFSKNKKLQMKPSAVAGLIVLGLTGIVGIFVWVNIPPSKMNTDASFAKSFLEAENSRDLNRIEQFYDEDAFSWESSEYEGKWLRTEYSHSKFISWEHLQNNKWVLEMQHTYKLKGKNKKEKTEHLEMVLELNENGKISNIDVFDEDYEFDDLPPSIGKGID